MNPYYVTEQCEELQKLVTDLYESYFDDDGGIVPIDHQYIDTGLLLQSIIAKCESLLEDIKQD